MPEVHLDISEQSTHIFDIVAEQCIHQNLQALAMTKHIDNRIYVDYGYSSIKNRTKNSLDPNLRNNKLNCTIELNLNPNAAKIENYTFLHAPSYGITKNYYKTSVPLFYDTDSNVRLYESVSPMSITTQYAFALLDKSLAYSLATRIRSLYGDGATYETKNISFDYPIPNGIMNLLYGLYKLKKTPTGGYPQYLIDASFGNINFNIDRTVQNIEPVILKLNTEVLSNVEYSEDKPVERKSSKTVIAYEVKFIHYIQFSAPNMLSLEYPIMIDNTIVPAELIVLNKSVPIPNLKSTSNQMMLRQEQNSLTNQATYPTRLPFYDDWIVPTSTIAKRYSYQEFYVSVFSLDEDEVTKTYTEYQTFDVLDSDSMGGKEFHPFVDHFLILQGQESFQHDVLFNITAYADNSPVGIENCYMDNFGNIKIKTVNGKAVHRLVVSELTDYRYLNSKWWEHIFDWMKNNCKTENKKCCPPLKVLDDYIKSGNPNSNDKETMVLRRMYSMIMAYRRNYNEGSFIL